MVAVAAKLSVFVEEHMGGGRDDIVGERQLPCAARLAAMDAAGCGVKPFQITQLEPVLGGELFGGKTRMRPEHHNGNDLRRDLRRDVENRRRLGFCCKTCEETKS